MTVPAGQWARTEVERGELLIGELRCTACHVAPEGLAARLDTADQPDLLTRLARRPPGFVTRYLESPQRLHPGGVMPDLLTRLQEAEKARVVRELTAFLNALVPPAVEEPRPIHPVRFQQGRVLYHRVGCLACHPPFEPADEVFELPNDTDPEEENGAADESAPPRVVVDLVELRSQWTPSSLASFLPDPRRNEPRRRMPPMNLTREETDAIAGYLLGREESDASGEIAREPPAASDEISAGGLIASGRSRFRELGCAACHRVEVDGRVLVSERVAPPLTALAGKGGRASCLSASRTGERTRPACCRRRPGEDPADAHSSAGLQVTPAPDRKDWAGRPIRQAGGPRSPIQRDQDAPESSASPGRPGGPAPPSAVTEATGGTAVPQYALGPEQAAAIRAALRALNEGLPRLTAADRVHRTLAGFNCLACHERSGRGGPNGEQAAYFRTLAAVDLGWEGCLPPHLNGVGAKLRLEWLQQVLAEGTRTRPYLATHMPTLEASIAATLANDLKVADRREDWQEEVALPTAPAGEGRVLVGTEGLACVTCHQFEGTPGLTMSVLDLAWTRNRLEWPWFRRYLVDPAALRPGTRMPSFWPEGRSALPDILGGDTDRQLAAIWAALQEANPPNVAISTP